MSDCWVLCNYNVRHIRSTNLSDLASEELTQLLP